MNGGFTRRGLVASSALLASVPTAARTDAAIDRAIRAVVDDMAAAWNRGDFRGYMAGFWNPGVVFVSGGRIQDGWQGTLDHYVRDYGGSPERRGTVRFFDMEIDVLAPDAAMLVGHFTLSRPANALKGINTRLFRRIGGRWVIAMNHVSSYTTTPADDG